MEMLLRTSRELRLRTTILLFTYKKDMGRNNYSIFFSFFLVGYVEERLWWPVLYKAPTKEGRRKRTAKRRERSDQV